jgi:signal peptidase II
LAVAAAVIVLDRLTKLIILQSMNPAESIPLIGGLLHITYVRNAGAAFGLFPGRQPLFFVTAGTVIGFIILYWLRVRPTDPWLVIGLGLELGGAVGNLFDRVAWGTVLDFIDVRFWPVFNVADSAIVIGLGMLLVAVVRQGRQEAQSKREAA